MQELRGLLASLPPNQPPAMAPHQSRGRWLRLVAKEELMSLFQPTLQASQSLLKAREGEAAHSGSWCFFDTTQNPTIQRGCFPFEAVTWEACHMLFPGCPVLKVAGDNFSTDSIFREGKVFFSTSPNYTAGIPLTDGFYSWKQLNRSQNACIFSFIPDHVFLVLCH